MKIPINIVTGQLREDEIIVGIDLGTTNSLVAYINKNDAFPKAISDSLGDVIVPSVIYFDKENNPVVGREALTHMISEPERTIYSAKRLMGKTASELNIYKHELSFRLIDDSPDGLIKVEVGGKYYSPIELSSLILAELKERASHFLRTNLTKAVITVPAYFNDAQRQATRDAGKMAGLDVLRIINEPTAASLAYGLGKKPKQTIVVYDLGGGTFDVSVLRIEDGVFEVLSTAGDTWLGGDDIDKLIVDYWKQNFQIIPENANEIQQVRILAEEAKKFLTEGKVFKGRLHFQHGIFEVNLTQDILNQIIEPLVDKTIECAETALNDAQLNPVSIEHLVLVGGSTKSPYIKNRVKSYFYRAQVHDNVNPDEVVALGAAIQADVLAGNRRDILLLDVTPLSLGIETLGGLMDTLIPRNSKIPCTAARQYTTSVDGQTRLKISIFQGERDKVGDNRLLGNFELSGIPAMPAGLPKVEITFRINADGLLVVTAKELRSEVTQVIELVPREGLNDEEVETRLKESLENAKTDVDFRMLTEARTEAEQMIYTTEKFLQTHVSHLSSDEIKATQHALTGLKESIIKNDRQLILKSTQVLNDITQPFAERIMDLAIASAMKGKKL